MKSPAPPVLSKFMVNFPELRTRADFNPNFLSDVEFPIKASLNDHDPELNVKLAVVYAVFVPVSKFSVINAFALGDCVEVSGESF